tara:strand:- start:8 stop:577 length:570 start_codon:yes stop_codon:yes gene_type:complete
MSGGKGGSKSTQIEIPEYLETAARNAVNRGTDVSELGYMPYYGPDVAGFTPMQQASFQNTADVSSAFGIQPQMSQQDIMGGMPPATQYAGGVTGYSSGDLYDQAVNELGERRPGQVAAYDDLFIDPNPKKAKKKKRRRKINLNLNLKRNMTQLRQRLDEIKAAQIDLKNTQKLLKIARSVLTKQNQGQQ